MHGIAEALGAAKGNDDGNNAQNGEHGGTALNDLQDV